MAPISAPSPDRRPSLRHTSVTLLWWLALAAGVAALVAGSAGVGPDVVGRAGAVTVAVAYTWALASRTGGRPIVFSVLAAVAGVGCLVWDRDELRTGAAVMMAALAAVLAVMITVPARRFFGAIREALVASAVVCVGAIATVGFEPVAAFTRFQYAAMAVALLAGFLLVYRLGAGLHGLGRRGITVVASGCGVLIVMLLYTELIRRYGTPGLVDGVHSGLSWMRNNLNGYPRPIQALLGIPALVWGTHMRARRREGWWVCAFGVAFTAPAAATLVNPDLTVDSALASLGYSLVVGIIIGFILIRAESIVTGSRTPARRSMASGEIPAVRTEPGRSEPLL